MSSDTRVYPLRRGRSPTRYAASPMTRRKLKSLQDQEVFEQVEVTTYNDNPEHLYGLDKNEKEVPDLKHANVLQNNIKNGNYKLTNNDIIKVAYPDISMRKKVHIIMFIASVILLCEAVILLDRWLIHQNKELFVRSMNEITPTGNSSDQSLVDVESLKKKISVQINIIQDMNERLQSLERNCSCVQDFATLQNEDKQQKALIAELQEQILTTVNVVKAMNQKIDDVQVTLTNSQNSEKEQEKKDEKSLCKGEECKLASFSVYASIHSALEVYNADILGLPDFALESAGGQIHAGYHSDTCKVGAAIIKIFGLPLWQDPRTPRAIIDPKNLPGNCWPMKGSNGYIVIKLATAIEPTMVTLEHLDTRLDQYTKEAYQSALQDFEVYAWLRPDGKEKMKLGTYTYSRESNAIQTFKLQNRTTIPVNYVELRVLSNHGNKDCTCIYRFRVHGLSYKWQQFEKATTNNNT